MYAERKIMRKRPAMSDSILRKKAGRDVPPADGKNF